VTQFQIHQALHGYADGHRELASTLKLTSKDAKLLLSLSDSSGPGLRFPSEGYLTGYPLADANYYVLARTWPAPEMPRPGCVWTHSILIDFADLAALENAESLLEFFRRPQDSDYSIYRRPLAYFARPVLAPRISDNCDALLLALYGTPGRSIVSSRIWNDRDRAALAIWSQQWPRLRRAFRFCSFSAADRSASSTQFDLQFIALGDRSIRSRFLSAVDADEVSSVGEAWLRDASFDLMEPNGRGLRSFLRQMGGDVSSGREAFIPLCRLHRLISELARGEAGISQAVDLLETAFPAGQVRAARHAVLLAAARSARHLNDKSWSYLLRHFAAIGSELGQEDREEIGLALWERDPRLLIDWLHDPTTAPIANNALASLPDISLIEALNTIPDAVPELLRRRPALVTLPQFWSLPNIDQELVWHIARDNPQLADSVADAIVAAGRDDLLRSAMRELGQMRVGKAVLTSGAVGVEDHWLGGASQYPNVVAELFVTRLLKRRQSLVVVARNTGPGELPNVRGQDPWDYALASSSGQLSDRDGIFLDSYLLSRALGDFSATGEFLTKEAFENVYSAIRRAVIPEDAWLLIDRRIPWSLFSKSRAARFIAVVADFVVDRKFRPGTFDLMAKDNNLWSSLASEVASTSRGRDYLRQVKKEMKKSNERQYGPRIKIIDKLI
jgi:hypothetical protein